MNRRLHTPIFACAASTAMLVLGLLVAWPAFPADEATGAGAAPDVTAAAGETRTPSKAAVDVTVPDLRQALLSVLLQPSNRPNRKFRM